MAKVVIKLVTILTVFFIISSLYIRNEMAKDANEIEGKVQTEIEDFLDNVSNLD